MPKQINRVQGSVAGTVVQVGTVTMNEALPQPIGLNGLPPRRLFVGRAEQVAELRGVLSPDSPVAVAAVAGLPGVGKTALVTHVAWQVRDEFPGGVVMIDMRGCDDQPVTVSHALGSLLVAVGMRAEQVPPDDQARMWLWRTVLAEMPPTLLIVDNALSAAQVLPLLPGHPGHRSLVTSRRRLAALENARHVTVPVLPTDACVELLRIRLSAEYDTNTSADGTARLVELCGWLPLALHTAVALLGTDSHPTVEDLVAALEDEQTRLSELDMEEDALSARAAFALSYRQLGEDEQRALRLLGVNRGPDMSLEAAAHLFQAGNRAARLMLQRLQRASLVDRRDRSRWAMHDLLRLFTVELAREDQLCRRAGVRLTDHYLRGARSAAGWLDPAAIPDNRFSTWDEALMWMDDEYLNLVSVFESATNTHKRALAAAMKPYLYLRNPGRWSDVARSAVDACRRLKDVDGEARARLLFGSSLLAARLAADAVVQHEMVLAYATEVADRNLESSALTNLGNARQMLGELDEADELYNRALEIRREIGDELGALRVQVNQATVRRRLGDPATAAAILEHVVKEADLADSHTGIVAAIQLGHTHREQGNRLEAERQYNRALRAFRGLRDVRGVAVVTSFLSGLASSVPISWVELMHFSSLDLIRFG